MKTKDKIVEILKRYTWQGIATIDEREFESIADELAQIEPEQPRGQPTDSDVENAAKDYIDSLGDMTESMSKSIKKAYKTGVTEMRDNCIYISAIDNRTRPQISSPQDEKPIDDAGYFSDN